MRRPPRLFNRRCFAVLTVISSPLAAQEITRDNYFDYLPPPRRIVTQTRATAALQLYGDRSLSSFRDVAPADGIDDARAARLLQIAERFSPIIKPNNFSVPRDWRDVLGPQQPLMSDLWVNGRRVRSDTILFERGASAGRVTLQSATGARETNDLLLARVLKSHGPGSAVPALEAAESDSNRVFFFDFPGSDPRSWRATYQRLAPHSGSRVFAHPFVSEAAGAIGEARYRLVVQFWFFYPFNDAINAHEGDWEHINVISTTRERARGATTAMEALLTAADLSRMLGSDYPLDSLVIAAVDHYIHQHVLTLDYIHLAMPEPASKRTVETVHDGHLASAEARYAWEDVRYARTAVRQRVSANGGVLATHPFVYTGGDNKGAGELLSLRPRFAKSLKRNSGASYPFPGIWQTVAGFAVTESVKGEVLPRLRTDTGLAWHALIADQRYLRYLADDIVLLPDWEQLLDQLETSAEFRREWGWLVLPVRWGFPVSPSPGGGIVKHANVGNIAPMGLASHAGWNRTGPTTEHSDYHVRTLRTPVSPSTPWAVVKNGWGFLNVPLALWGLMPGYNVGLIQLMPWMSGAMHLMGAPPRRTFTPDQLPRRFTTAGQGLFREFGGRDFARLLTQPASRPDAGGEERRTRVGPRIWFNLHFGEHLSLENTYSWTTDDIRYLASSSSATTPVSVAGSLDMRQLTGGFRYDLKSLGTGDHVQLFARGGYGWLWYRAGNERYDGIPTGASHPSRGYLPTLLPAHQWLPNTLYAGGGIEAFSPRRFWLLGLLGYGLRAEFTGLGHRVSFGGGSGRRPITTVRTDLATSLVFGW